MAPLLSRKQVALIYNVDPETVSRWTKAGKLPQPIVFNCRVLRWKRDDVTRLLENTTSK